VVSKENREEVVNKEERDVVKKEKREGRG